MVEEEQTSLEKWEQPLKKRGVDNKIKGSRKVDLPFLWLRELKHKLPYSPFEERRVKSKNLYNLSQSLRYNSLQQPFIICQQHGGSITIPNKH